MWLTLALTAGTIVAYAVDRFAVELVALSVLCALLLLFELAPLATGAPPTLAPEAILAGFANPALVTVIALLVIGQGMINTGVLDGIAGLLVRLGRDSFHRSLAFSLASVGALSGFLNNTPVVVILLPVLRNLAAGYRRPPSAVMMPLSFTAILGGMATLIGSSSNLLVAGAWAGAGMTPIGFFDITLPGLILALVGLAYVLLLPALLPGRSRPDSTDQARQFVAELDLGPQSPLIGARSESGSFKGLDDVTVRLIQREDQVFLPPFGQVELAAGDVLIVAATRNRLTALLAADTGRMLPPPAAGKSARQLGPKGDLMLAEVMVKPASRMIGQTIELTNFPARTRCAVLGVQRRARMVRARLGELRLEAGDVLLLIGPHAALTRLRNDLDVILMEWSTAEMPVPRQAPLAGAIFLGVILAAAFDLLPIVIAAVTGAVALIGAGCLNIRQAARAVDRKIVLVIASSLALGAALEATGGAAYVAGLVLGLTAGASPGVVLSVFFLLIAALTNILSNNACAVLFTPIAVQLASALESAPLPFALAVIFAANCSFATPISYQTNLLVMGPGRYRFADFLLAGLPLIFLLWLTFSMVVPWLYAL
jgi:di/tricarboxylate transporter